MGTGFNTDVTHGDRVFHVQTEDRGPQYCAIDTVVYQNGRILHRYSSTYADPSRASTAANAESAKRRVEQQHRGVIESLRVGALDAEIAAAIHQANEQALRAAGIQVQLLNPTSWLSSGNVCLSIAVNRRADGQLQSGAQVDAFIDGSVDAKHHGGVTDNEGRIRIEFPMPILGKGDLVLVIQAQTDGLRDEIRFNMRSRTKPKPPSS